LTWADGRDPIPRMFRERWQAVASGCIRLHAPGKIDKDKGPVQGLNPCLGVVGRLGLEPRTYGLKEEGSL
ncbi:hypothetical protein, partial [Streptosporangium sandarakinum]|uniref:hypothetical protein n=1 Tax=Streptosporangium sandarakinum TaxID=1260955 RepID=UPI00341C27C1